MRTLRFIFVTCILLPVSISCGSNNEMFVVVQKDQLGRIEMGGIGKIEIKYGKSQIWKHGQIVLFRCDATIRGQSGKEGMAYRLDKNLRLDKMGTFDLEKSN